MIEVGIIGSGGYVAGELIRCLLQHPNVHINFLYSTSQAGKEIAEVHEDLFSYSDLYFTHVINKDVDIVFLCLGHGNSIDFLKTNSFSEQTKIIDLSNDFRLEKDAIFEGRQFVYGLVELNKTKIKEATNIANPGCFATAIQLGILPLAKSRLLKNDIHTNAITGATGAGQSYAPTSHFSWRNNNISVYKAFRHQHLGEIKESIISLQSDFHHDLNFIPVRGNFTRGIFATSYVKCHLSEEELINLYSEFYKNSKFTFVSRQNIHLKQVVNTNNCLIQVQKIDNNILITSMIDNLLKGAAGQAIQNMNIMFELEETTGIQFKASYF